MRVHGWAGEGEEGAGKGAKDGVSGDGGGGMKAEGVDEVGLNGELWREKC